MSPVRGRSRDEATSPTAANGTSPRSPGGSVRPLGQGRIRFTDKVRRVLAASQTLRVPWWTMPCASQPAGLTSCTAVPSLAPG